MNEEDIEVWFTQNALTERIAHWKVKANSDEKLLFDIQIRLLPEYNRQFFHFSKKEALAKAEKMRAEKIAELKQEIGKLQSQIQQIKSIKF